MPGQVPDSVVPLGTHRLQSSSAIGSYCSKQARHKGRRITPPGLALVIRPDALPGTARTLLADSKIDTVLAPGVSEPVSVQLGRKLPRGPWQADLGLTSGLIHRSVEATITFPSGVGSVHAPVAAGFPSLLVVIIVLIVLLAITALALLVARRRIWRLRPL